GSGSTSDTPSGWTTYGCAPSHGRPGSRWSSRRCRPSSGFASTTVAGSGATPVTSASWGGSTRPGPRPGWRSSSGPPPPLGGARAHALGRDGGAEWAPHTWAPWTSLFYGDAAGEYSPARFVEIFREIDETLGRLAVRPSRILSDHDHGWSASAIPGLPARDIGYKMNITTP